MQDRYVLFVLIFSYTIKHKAFTFFYSWMWKPWAPFKRITTTDLMEKIHFSLDLN